MQTIRNMEYFDLLPTMDKLYEQSLGGHIFYSLVKLILSIENILLAYRNLKSNKGSKTPGPDGRTIDEISALGEEELIWTVRKKFMDYKPGLVKRVEIPKRGSDKTRPLGIPCILDRLVQQCIKQVLEPILEAKFYPYSFGFRPTRKVEHAIHRFCHLVNRCGLHYVVDVDIKGFFDHVDHNKLKKQLWTLGIRDKKLLSVINAMLKAPILMPDGTVVIPEMGTPQGSILSPLLANVVLNELDWWIASQWETFPARYEQNGELQDYSGNGNRYKALRKSGLKEMYIVRYADDFKIFARTREEAERIQAAVELWLKERLSLETSPEKTRITNLRKENSEFLGFRFKLKEKGGKLVLRSRLTNKAKEHIKQMLSEQIAEIQHAGSLEERTSAIQVYNSMVMGVHEYYSLATEISKDLADINKGLRVKLYNRLLKEEDNPREGEINPESAIAQKYGDSKQLRFVSGSPLVPLAYCKMRIPLGRDKEMSIYTPEGREKVHSRLGVNLSELRRLMSRKPHSEDSVEFVVNRTAKYCAQYGRCAVTGTPLTAENMHCHHINPSHLSRDGPDDSYENLILVTKEVHRLIHSTKEETILGYLNLIEKDEQLDKINYLRKMAGNSEIFNVFCGGIQLNFLYSF